jgi:hypothetical protein
MIDTGQTLSLAARTLKENGARAVHACISHGEFYCLLVKRLSNMAIALLSETNIRLIETLPLDSLVVCSPSFLLHPVNLICPFIGYEHNSTKTAPKNMLQVSDNRYRPNNSREHP